MHYFKKTLLAAAMAAFSLTVAFPAFADEPVGTDVTIVEAGTSDTSEESSQDIQETSASRESKGRRAVGVRLVGSEMCIRDRPLLLVKRNIYPRDQASKKKRRRKLRPPGRHPLDGLPSQDTAAANSAPAVIILPFPVRFPPQTTLFPLI